MFELTTSSVVGIGVRAMFDQLLEREGTEAAGAAYVWDAWQVAIASGRISFAPYSARPLIASWKPLCGRYASVLEICCAKEIAAFTPAMTMLSSPPGNGVLF